MTDEQQLSSLPSKCVLILPMLCLVVTALKFFSSYALPILSMPEHQKCWLLLSCSCTGVSTNSCPPKEPFHVVQLNGFTQKFLTGFLFHTQVSGNIKEHWAWQTALEMYWVLGFFFSTREIPHETTLALMWDDLTFHFLISCSFCWSLLAYVFVSMLKLHLLGKSHGINSKE